MISSSRPTDPRINSTRIDSDIISVNRGSVRTTTINGEVSMFTGIIEAQGSVLKLVRRKNLFVLKIECQRIVKGTKVGDSVAIDGVCLTVTRRDGNTFDFDLMQETITTTTLKYLRPGSQVNLERAIKVGGRLGGHFVTGHVDGVGTVKNKATKANYAEFQIACKPKLILSLVPKGSVCVDGISLTVGGVSGNVFAVYLIPHTLEVTTLGAKEILDRVNVETDILAKYVAGSGSRLQATR